MKFITLDELIDRQNRSQRDSEETLKQFKDVSIQLCKSVHKNKKVTILTDYDADGVCSAYIMEKIVKTIKPECEVNVICNDRRNAYGVPKDLTPDKNSLYIVLDMGSNEAQYIFETFGENTFIIDHHEITDKNIANSFRADNTLLNLYSFKEKDGNSSEYCTAGLAYRLYSVIQQVYTKFREATMNNIKQNNSVAIMSCIGTVADCVPLCDPNSYNRDIVRKGMDLINNADESNIDYTLGYFLTRCGLSEKDITAHDIGFLIAPVINAGGRMSAQYEMNGAQFVFDALTGKPDIDTYDKLDFCIKMNTARKEFVASLQNEDYCRAVDEERTKPGNVCVYRLPDDTPHSVAGLIAGRFASAVGKATIAVTYNSEKGYFSGSCRSHETIESSLLEFMQSISTDMPDFQFGGHAAAAGISKLTMNDYETLCKRVEKHSSDMKYRESERLQLAPEELFDPLTLEKFIQLEPVGKGFEIPPIELQSTEASRDKLFSKNTESSAPFKKVRLTYGKKSVYISDYAYSADTYPQFSDNKTIRVLAVPQLSYTEKSGVISPTLSFTTVYDKEFLEQYREDVAADRGLIDTVEETKEEMKETHDNSYNTAPDLS